MASLSKIIDVHSHAILAFGEGRKQLDWTVESALSYMEEHDISACVLSAPASTNNATGQEARDIARRTNEVVAEIISKHPNLIASEQSLDWLGEPRTSATPRPGCNPSWCRRRYRNHESPDLHTGLSDSNQRVRSVPR
jgi:4-alpha-glucanotransferase